MMKVELNSKYEKNVQQKKIIINLGDKLKKMEDDHAELKTKYEKLEEGRAELKTKNDKLEEDLAELKTKKEKFEEETLHRITNLKVSDTAKINKIKAEKKKLKTANKQLE